MIISPARRTSPLKSYYFAIKNPQLAALSAERVARGEDPVVNLGIGAPDGMPPQPAIDALCECAHGTDSHKYQNYFGLPQLRKAIADWYARYYRVELDFESEVQPLIGSKEGIFLICMAFLNEGDRILMPDPGYPTYVSSTILAGGQVEYYQLHKELGWQPDFDELEKMDLEGVKLMWVNYPNMPTGAPATMELYRRLVDFAMRHRIMIVNDNPYSFVLNDKPLSIMEVDGAKECCVELNSLSKAHNMSGWRLGMAIGCPEAIRVIRTVKSQMDSGMFKPLQMSAIAALEQGEDWFKALNTVYRERKLKVQELFDRIGASYEKDSQGLFVWGEVTGDCPFAGDPSDAADPADGHIRTLGERVSDNLLAAHGIFVVPGMIFGKGGSNFIRASLCADVATLQRAVDKL